MGQGRFSGVQFLRMGQLNRLARYPIHFHMIGHGGNVSLFIFFIILFITKKQHKQNEKQGSMFFINY